MPRLALMGRPHLEPSEPTAGRLPRTPQRRTPAVPARYLAEDAVDSVVVDYDALPAVVDPRTAIGADSPRACVDAASNLFIRFDVGYGDCAKEFASARHVFRESLFQHRGVAHPMEGRGVLAHMDPGTRTLVVWSSTQLAHEVRDNIAEMLDLAVDRVRVILPDLG